MDSLVEQALVVYEQARNGGLDRKEAKRRAYEKFPGLREATSTLGGRGSAVWARGVQKIDNRFCSEESLPLLASGETKATLDYTPTKHIQAYIDKNQPSIGDVLTFNLHHLAFLFGKANDSAWRYTFSPEGPLSKAGWRFEVVNNSAPCYQVRVVERPQTEAERERVRQEIARLDEDYAARRALLVSQL